MGTIDQAMNYLADDLVARKTITKPVTLPFTAPCNGMLLVYLRASTTTGRFYETVSNAYPGIVDGYSVGSMYAFGWVYVEKGKTVTRTSSANVQTRDYAFLAL